MSTAQKQRVALKLARIEAMRRARNARFYSVDNGDPEVSQKTLARFRELCAEYVREARELNHQALRVR